MKNKKLAIIIGGVLALAILIYGLVSCNPGGIFKSEYDVCFYTNTGTLLDVQVVKRGESAEPPAAPVMAPGYMFKGWDKDFTNVTRDLDVHAVCEEIPQDGNVLLLEGTEGKVGAQVIMPLRLTGQVCLAGFDAVISYDNAKLEFVEMSYEDGAVVSNVVPEEGKININYLSTDNTTGEVDLCDCVFQVIDGAGTTTDVTLTLESAVAVDDKDAFYTPECQLIDAVVEIREQQVTN